MGSQPAAKPKLRKGLWSPEEDEKLVRYITKYGHKCWSIVPKQAGLQRCGKSCRLRWINYLRPDLKRGHFTQQEEELIIKLHSVLGNRWAQIATQLPGRTDNEIKNFWNSCLRKKLRQIGIDPQSHKPIAANLSGSARSAGEVIELPIDNHESDDQVRSCHPQPQCSSLEDNSSFTLSMLPITLSPHPSRTTSTNFFPQAIGVGFQCNQPIHNQQEATETSSVFSFWMENSTSTSTSGSQTSGSPPSSCSDSDSWSCFPDGLFSPTGTGSILKSWGLLDASILDTKMDLASWQQQQQSSKSLAQFYDPEPTESDPISDVLDQM